MISQLLGLTGLSQANQFAQMNAQNMLNAYRPRAVEMTPWDLGLEASDAPYSFWLGADR